MRILCLVVVAGLLLLTPLVGLIAQEERVPDPAELYARKVASLGEPSLEDAFRFEFRAHIGEMELGSISFTADGLNGILPFENNFMPPIASPTNPDCRNILLFSMNSASIVASWTRPYFRALPTNAWWNATTTGSATPWPSSTAMERRASMIGDR